MEKDVIIDVAETVIDDHAQALKQQKKDEERKAKNKAKRFRRFQRAKGQLR